MKNLNTKVRNFYAGGKQVDQIEEEQKIGQVIGRMSSSGMDRSVAYL